jgi:TolB protein
MKDLTILLTLTLLWLLTGCAGFMGHEEESVKLAPIDRAAWPTPAPIEAAAKPSPTPFPKSNLPTATPTAAVVFTSPALPTAETPAIPAAVDEPAATESNVTAETAANPALGTQMPLVAVGFTTSQIALRQGPGTSYGTASTKVAGDLVGILGTNSSRDWVYAVDSSLNQGWLPLSALRLMGSLAGAPVLPPNPMAMLAAAMMTGGNDIPASASEAITGGDDTPSGSGQAMTGGNAATSAPAETAAPSIPALPELKPVTTAQVNSTALNLRQGPGSRFDKLATLVGQDTMDILALNPDKTWALVDTKKGRGWVSLSFLTAAGSVDNAPVISPEQATLTDQPPPAAAAGEANTSAAPTSNISTSTPDLALASLASTSTSPYPNLASVAQAVIAGAGADIRPGPGPKYAPIDRVTQSDVAITILGQDSTGQWLLVKPDNAQLGWAALSDLKIEGDVSGAPPVTTAWVESNGIETRRGPALFHEVNGSLSMRTLVSVLGVDKTRSWLLVKPIPSGQPGYAPANFLTVSIPLAQLPVVDDEVTPPSPAQASAAVAPITPARSLNQSQIVIQTSSGGDIMVINPDGSGLRRLTGGIDPVLSPDGQTVAFTRWQGETGSLWLIDIDGRNEREVMGNIKQAKGREWSPDGRNIVLNFQHGGRLESKTECFNLAKGDPPFPPRNATNFRVKFGQNGPQFCWTLPPDPHWGLRVINLADGSYKDVDGGTYAFRPAWDPTRDWRIVSDGGRGLVELDVNRDYRQTITDEINDGSPVFSPDGRYILVTLGQQGGGPGYDIFRLNADGTGRVRLTQTPLWETALPQGEKLWNNVAPTWSPDGQQIIFLTDRTGRWQIWVMNLDGSEQRPFFSNEVNEQLPLTYNFVDERSLSWR